MKKITKALSLLLTFCILASCMAFSVLADNAAYLDLSASETIYLKDATATLKVYSTEYSTADEETAATSTLLSNSGLTFSSSNENAFTVDSEGTLTAKALGRSLITVSNGSLTSKIMVVCYETENNAKNGWSMKEVDDPANIEGRKVKTNDNFNGNITLNSVSDNLFASVWFYDSMEGNYTSTNSIDIRLSNNNFNYLNFTESGYKILSWQMKCDSDFTAQTAPRSKGWHQLSFIQQKTADEKLNVKWYIDGKLIYKHTSALPIAYVFPRGYTYLYNPKNAAFTDEAVSVSSTETLTGLDLSEMKTDFAYGASALSVGDIYANYSVTTPAYTDADGIEHTEATVTERRLLSVSDLSFSVSDDSVLEIADGLVTPKKLGSTSVTVAYGEASQSITLNVNQEEDLGLDLSEMTSNFNLSDGETAITGIYKAVSLGETGKREAVETSDVSFSVSDESVLTIANGSVTPKTTGSALVKVTCGDYSKNIMMSVYDDKAATLSGTPAANDSFYGEARKVYTGSSSRINATANAYDDEKNYNISTWFYDPYPSSLSLDSFIYTNARYFNLFGAENAKYYDITGFNSEHITKNVTSVKRSQGWHQLFVTIGAGSYADNANAKKVSIYIDGELAYTYNDSGFYIHSTVGRWINDFAKPSASVMSYTQKAKITETSPSNGETNVPLYTAFSATFEKEINDSDLFTITDGSGKAVFYKATLSKNKRKITLNAGKLSPSTTYTVALKSDESVKYTFTTRAAEEEYLLSTLDAMNGKYELSYQRAFGFGSADKKLEEYGVYYSNTAMPEGLNMKIENSIASFEFDANTEKSGSIVFTNIGGGAPIDGSKLADNDNDPDVIIMKYKYRLRVEGVSGETEEEKANIEETERKNFKHFGNINMFTSTTATTNRSENGLWVQSLSYTDGGTLYFQANADSKDGRQRENLIDSGDTADNKWIDVTYVIERSGHSASENEVTYSVKVSDSKIFTVTKKAADYGVAYVSQGITASTSAYKTAIDIADYQVYGFERLDSYGELKAFLADFEGNITENPAYVDSMGGKSVIASLDVTSASDKAVTVIFALFDKSSNMLIDLKTASASLTANTNKTVTSEAFAISQDEGGNYEFKAFVWESGKMTPVISAPTYAKTSD